MRFFRPRHPLPILSWVLLAAALLTGCASPDGPLHRGYNVIFILADTLRADHLGSYGYERATSPFLDELARSNVQFLNVRSQAACTYPSVNSMLTSRNVFTFHDPATRPAIPEDVPSLPEILKANGYRTIAVSASPIVRDTPSPHNPKGGFGRGFDVFDEKCHWYQSTCVSTLALRRLVGGDGQGKVGRPRVEEPFFLYLHYMDPHDPYVAIKTHRGRFAGSYDGEHRFIAEGDPNPIDALIRRGTAASTLSAEDFRHLIDLYDEEIYSLDYGLRQLFEDLGNLGLLERSIVVVASDHGEAFFEHGRVKHCFTVYDNETRVPLILRLPKLSEPVRRATWVQNLDIVPTLLDYLGIDAEPYAFEGRSLRPVIESREAPPRPAFSAMASMRSVNDDRFKLVLDYKERSYALFDLIVDAAEKHDVSGEEREAYYRLLRELKAWIDEVETGTEAERLERAQEIEDELRSLGYLGG